MSDHSGHRQRLKERFREEGLDHFSQINALELLLFYCVSRKDTNELAHNLLDHFGSFSQVLDAKPEELEKVPGIGEHTATFLSLITDTFRYYHVNKTENPQILNTITACGKYMVNFFRGKCEETVYVLCLDAKCKILCCKEIGKGGVNSTGVSVRKIVETALNVKATTVVLAHNHPSGLALPSAEDVESTKWIAKALRTVDVTLADHVIVADDDFISLVQSGKLDPLADSQL